jgi:hypothetical protein
MDANPLAAIIIISRIGTMMPAPANPPLMAIRPRIHTTANAINSITPVLVLI